MAERKLLFALTISDFEVQTFRSGGPGGQNQNKRDTGVRLIHPPSGARGESREERSQLQNKKQALKKLVKQPQFLFWVHETARKLEGYKSSEETVDEWMSVIEDFKIEVKDHQGKWTQVSWWDLKA